ncbi:MAG: hypothetical protein OHK0024_21560 [Thalassobaculales bacterium]
MAGPDPELTPGVYAEEPGGTPILVHAYEGDHYGLEQVESVFGIGRYAGLTLTLTGREARLLHSHAAAYSFDHPAEFIAMCADIARFAAGRDMTFRDVP